MAGQFESVIGIRGFDAFAVAVKQVLASHTAPARPTNRSRCWSNRCSTPRRRCDVRDRPGDGPVRPSRHLRGRRRTRTARERRGARLAVRAGHRTPRCSSSTRTTVRSCNADDLRRLVALSTSVATVFGGPQDVEWAIAPTASCGYCSRGRSPPRSGACRAVRSTAPDRSPRPSPSRSPSSSTTSGSRRCATRCGRRCRSRARRRSAELEASEVVVDVDGHVAIDLQARRRDPPEARPPGRCSTRFPPAHRLRGAWRVGRLRAALPRLSEDLLDRVDADLESVPALVRTDEPAAHRPVASQPRDPAIAPRARDPRRHAHRHRPQPMTGTSVALRVLVEARQDGLSDTEVLARSPVVLALTPPRVSRPLPMLPADASAIHLGARRRQPQRQRHPAGGAPAPGPLGAGALGPGRVGAR